MQHLGAIGIVENASFGAVWVPPTGESVLGSLYLCLESLRGGGSEDIYHRRSFFRSSGD
jgi:hypothetical protein